MPQQASEDFLTQVLETPQKANGNIFAKRIESLRAQMKLHNVDAWIIPSADPHSSEYQCARWQTRPWLSGFTGSAGTAVVLQDCSGVWADGRYHIQAAQQLAGSGITLFKQGLPEVPEFEDWLADTLPEGATVGFDGNVISTEAVETMRAKFARKNISLSFSADLIDEVWSDRPEVPADPIFDHPVKYAGLTRTEKLTAVRENMATHKADWFLVSSLDDIAWLYNFRGSDLPNCPITLSFALVSREQAWLCIDAAKVPDALRAAMASENITLLGYEDIYNLVEKIPAGDAIFLHKKLINSFLASYVNKDCFIIDGVNLTTRLKAVKNSIEIAHFKKCLIRDGSYVVKFMKWMEEQVAGSGVTEMKAAAYLKSLRAQDPEFQGVSFNTIPGYAEHGALMHYSSSPETDVAVKAGSFFLVDSGGLYSDGTTDITRTFSYGDLTAREIRDYTLVLKGHINLDRAIFLHGTRGLQLDVLARGDMWRDGINYGCGTGHGVGAFLNVHEGPQSISPRFIDEAILPGMVVTNEPGIYREGEHGVRIENIMLCVDQTKTEFGSFYAFETMTICPIETRSVDPSLLNADEITWLNSYHEEVYAKLSPFLDEEHCEYLKNKTQAIKV